jgi:hypothetical protein
MKFKWKVAPAPTGHYRSFESRSWPSAKYPNGQPALLIRCETDEYVPSKVKNGDHGVLSVCIAQYYGKKDRNQLGTFAWRTLKARFATLDEAKAAGEKFLNGHPEYHPKESKE